LADCDHKVLRGSVANVLDPVQVISGRQGHAAWTEAVTLTVNRKLDVSLANQPELTVSVFVGCMRHGPWRKHGFVNLNVLASGKLAIDHRTSGVALSFFLRQIFEWESSGRKDLIVCRPGTREGEKW
jgi:hypothetical protein